MKSPDGFVRDPESNGVVINTDMSGLKAYKLKKKQANEVEALRTEVKELKSMLQQLILKMG